MSFSVTDIAYFLEVVRHGHVGRAAEAVGVTQPSVSKAIRRLEAHAGVTLLDRGSHGVRLTPQGVLFSEAAQRMATEHHELERTAQELRAHHAGMLRVGLTNGRADTPAVRALAALVAQRPGLRLTLVIDRSDTLQARVEQGELDVAVVPAYPDARFACDALPIGQDPALPAARRDHPLLQRANLALADLAEAGWVMGPRHSAMHGLVRQAFRAQGLPEPRVVVQAEYTSDAVMGLVSSSDLLCMAPTSVLRNWAERVHPLPLGTALQLPRTVTLLARRGNARSALVDALKERLLANSR